MHKLKVVVLLVIFLSLYSNANALFGNNKSAPFFDLPVAQSIDSHFNKNLVTWKQKIDAGKIQKGSIEARIELIRVIDTAFKKDGYSFEATFRTAYNQRDLDFWTSQFSQTGYANFFMRLGQYIAEPAERGMLLKNGLITPETVTAYEKYIVWAREIEKNRE